MWFSKALLGLSGGIDSALVAVIATVALGPDAITTLLMPSPWSSNGSIEDATSWPTARARQPNVPIAPLMQSFGRFLVPALDGEPQGVTAENLQSRIRGTLLMAVANQQGQLLLTTGNKSELAVGYRTLYGDMNGGLAVIGDLYKPRSLPSATGWTVMTPAAVAQISNSCTRANWLAKRSEPNHPALN